MKTFKKNISGITLIALVITIIVLLILAGVTLASVVGNNGVIKKSMKAKGEALVAKEKEAISVAYDGVKIDVVGNAVSAEDLENELKYNGNDVTVQPSAKFLVVRFNDTQNVYYLNAESGSVVDQTENQGKIIAVIEKMDYESSTQDIVNKLEEELGDTAGVEYDNENDKIIITIDEDGDGKADEIYEVDSDGNVTPSVEPEEPKEPEPLSVQVKKSTNIGKKVNFVSKYNSDLIWRLFYADDDYVYLISSKLTQDEDGNEYEIEAQRTNYGGLGGLGLISQESTRYSGAQAVTDPFLRSLNSAWYNELGNEECDNENAKAIAWFMDQNVWKGWKDADGLTEYVIAGPTVELLAKSYNATAEINEVSPMTYSTVEKWGYETLGADLQNTFNNGIYHLRGGEDSFWLASPGGACTNEEWQGKSIRTSGGTTTYGGIYIVYFGANFYNLGVRPVVIIPTDRFAESNLTILDE